MFYIIGFYTAAAIAVILLFLFIRSMEIINRYEDFMLHNADLRRRKEPEEAVQTPYIPLKNNNDDDFWDEYIKCECASDGGGFLTQLKNSAENCQYEFRLFAAKYFIRMPKEIKCRIRKFDKTYILQEYLKYL